MSVVKRTLQIIVCALIYLLSIECKDYEILEPSDLTYDVMMKQNNYTKEYRILKKKKNGEEAIMVSLDSLGYNYVLRAKYIYDNEEVNEKQEYVFHSQSNHLFLIETMQRSPSTNKTLIQLYQQSTLIGYELRLSVLPSNIQDSTSEFEYSLIYFREEDIDYLEDGTSTKFLNMFSGDSEWRKINFPCSVMEMMIFTLENAYEIEMYMYSISAFNLTSRTQKNNSIPYTVSKYQLKNNQQSQTVMILLRRKYNIDANTTPSIIDFNISILSIFTKNYQLSIFHNDFANFDVLLPIFNIAKMVKSKSISDNSLPSPNNNSANSNDINNGKNEALQQHKNQTRNNSTSGGRLHPPFQNVSRNGTDHYNKNNKVIYSEDGENQEEEITIYFEGNGNQNDNNQEQQQTEPENNVDDLTIQGERLSYFSSKRLLGLSTTDIDTIKNVMQYELVVPVYNYSSPFYLGSVASSCNSYIKYQLRTVGEEYSNNRLMLNETEVEDFFTDKYTNIDQTSTSKILIKPSEYKICQPNCQVHAILHIEILADPLSDFDTFKIQGSQMVHDLSNPSKPFFDYLPLLSYTFFTVEVPEDLNQLTIQYFSGYQHCYLMFSHSYIPSMDSLKGNQTIPKVIGELNTNTTNEEKGTTLQRLLQYTTNSNNQKQTELIESSSQNFDERPVRKNFILDTYYPTFQQGQLIVKPAKKGIHIFSALNISPMYSPFTVQVNSFNLRQMTNSSYISITLNGINDLQSLYYDKTHNKNNEVLLQFCSILTDVTIFATTCPSNQTITSCPTPSASYNKFNETVTAKNASIPDLCPSQMCHILFTVQYTPLVTVEKMDEEASESSENTIKKFSVTLIEKKDESSNSDNQQSSNNGKQSGTSSGTVPSDSSDYRWVIIACCILLGGIVIASILMCYIKVRQNKILREIKRQKKELLGNYDDQEEEEEEDDDDDGIKVGREFRIQDVERNSKRQTFSITEDLNLERTNTN